MPDKVDWDIDTIPNLHDVPLDDIPPSVLKLVIGRWQVADQAGYSVSAFQNYVSTGEDELNPAA